MAEEIPKVVLDKLEACGATLSSEEWSMLPMPARERLIQLSADERVAMRAYFGFVEWLRETFSLAAAN